MYVTERCVFDLSPKGLELIEIAPGVDIERDILKRMEFEPVMRRAPQSWIQEYFRLNRWHYGMTCCACRYVSVSLITRKKINSSSISKGTLFATSRMSNAYRRIVESMLSDLGHKVHVIVNYNNFKIFPDIVDEYSAMVGDLADRFYSGATRYTTNAFLRTKLGSALSRRALAPHIYESADEARSSSP